MDINTVAKSAELRRRAEERLNSRAPINPALLSETDRLQLARELQVRQIELEIQNEELLYSREGLAAVLEEYKSLYDHSPASYVILHRDGIILQANLTFEHLIGVHRALLFGRRLSSFVAESDRGVLNAFIEQVFNTRAKQVCEAALLNELDQSAPFYVRMEGTVSANGQECRLVLIDVTERKRAETALRESETRLREVLENSLDASYKRNLQTNTYEYMSPVFAQISGYTPDEMETLPIEIVLGLMHPDDAAEVERVMAESMSGAAGATYHVEYRFRHKDGDYRWLRDQFTVVPDAEGRLGALIGSVSDVTARRQDEERLLANQQYLRRLAQRLVVLRVLDQAIQQADAVDEIANQALRSLSQLIPFTTASVIEYDASARHWTPLVIQTDTPAISARFPHFSLPAVFTNRMNTDHYYVDNDVKQTPRCRRWAWTCCLLVCVPAW